MRPMNPRTKAFFEGLVCALAFGTAMVYGSADAEESVGVGVSGTNSGGCDIPDVSVSYERTSEALEVFGRVRTGGNRFCEDTVNADISIERDFGRVSIDLGYDRRSVAVQHKGDVFTSHWGSVDAASVSLNIDVGLFEVGYDVVNEAPRVEADFAFRGVGFNVDAVVFDGSPVYSGRGSYEFALKGGWNLELFGSIVVNVNDMGDGIDWSSEPPPSEPDDTVWSYGIGFTKEL